MKTIELAFVRSTKNTHVYADDRDGAPVPSLYVKREALPTKPPEKIKVTIEWL